MVSNDVQIKPMKESILKSSSQNLLIIDSHSSSRFAIQYIAKKLNWQITCAARTVAEARESAAIQPWSMLVTELQLPDGNGFSLLREIRARGDLRPILIYSSSADALVTGRILKMGGSGYLNKTSELSELECALCKLAQGRKYISSGYAEELAAQLAGDSTPNLYESLSTREAQVLHYIVAGLMPCEIAREIGCGVNTVSTFRHRILKKLGLKNNMELVRYAIKYKLV